MAGILLAWKAVVSGTNVTVKPQGPWDIIRRLRVNLNLGSASIVDVSGYGLYLMNLLSDVPLNTNAFFGSMGQWVYYVPISANLGENFSTGLILLQDPQIRATIEIQWNSLSAVYNGSDLSVPQDAGLEVFYVYWEVPNLEKVSQPPLVLHRIVEDSVAFSKNGDNVYLVPRQGILLQMLHIIYANGAFAAWEKASLRLNRVDTVQEFTPAVAGALQVIHTGFSTSRLPYWVVPYDFFSASYRAGMSDLRDAIDTEAVTTIESVISIPSYVSLGSGNNYINTIRRILQPIQP
jgi:hypothetical protein